MNNSQDAFSPLSPQEKDDLFDYKDIDTSLLTRFELEGVPFDDVSRDEAVAKIIQLIEKASTHSHVLFLDPPKFMKMKSGKKLNRIPKKASLVLHDEAGIRWAANQCGINCKERVTTIGVLMDLFRYSEKKDFTVFFLGSREHILERLNFILVRRFPNLRIVGRQYGHFSKPREAMIKEVIRKSCPDVILFAMDSPEQELWIENNTDCFGKAVVIGVSGTFDVLSGLVKKSPTFFYERGLTWLWRTISQPWRIGRVMNILHFYLLFTYRGFKNKVPKGN
jgi:N-acetylglucosaminyldiphosphoundecaprenol N-acetyl-beta-D-mannosaminyltransferase